MEPGIPDPDSRATRLGIYNVDPAVRFWATPPIHGILRPTVVHPELFTFKLPDNVSFAEAAMVEPLAVGVHGATKAAVKPGRRRPRHRRRPDRPGHRPRRCSPPAAPGSSSPTSTRRSSRSPRRSAPSPRSTCRSQDLAQTVLDGTDGWGADVVFECSGNPRGAAGVFEPLCPGGRVVFIGGQCEPIAYDVGAAMVREARVEHVFRYAHVFPRCIAMLSSGAIDVKPLITRTFGFDDSVEAFELAASAPKGEVKMQIELPQ